MDLHFITSNKNKIIELTQFLNYPVTYIDLDLIEIQSLDLREIVEHKAKEAYSQIQKPVLVDDVSLIFHALNSLPGPLVKWFVKSIENAGLCKLLNENEDRKAIAEVAYGFYDGKEFQYCNGTINGSIAHSPKGLNGFGWDAIFIPTGYQKTRGEMNPEEQNNTSMRKIALKKLQLYLDSNTTI
ncbi:MAG: non-canonical purine NTP pyrophosphatase [Candidatus Roizmanbacteria bacterium]